MLKMVESIYQNGWVEFAEIPDSIDETQAADLRSRLRTFEEDRNNPDMDGYDALCPAAV